MLYLDQYQNGLLAAEVEALRTQARIYAGGIAEAATRLEDDRAVLVPELARPLLRRLTDPSPNTQARLFDNTGLVVADSRVREGAGGAVVTEPLPPQAPRGAFSAGLATLYDRLVALVPRGAGGGRGADLVVDVKPDAPAFDWQPDLGPDRREELRLALEGGVTPYIRRTGDGQLLVSVAEPARRGNQPVGIVLLTREAREVDQRLFEIRASVLGIFAVALVLTVLLSFYLAQTLASPIMQLAGSAAAMRQGEGRTGSVPLSLLSREDEIGILARDLQRAARDLWARIDTNERFAADVAHELRNPLTSVRSAIETLRRIENPEQQRRLLGIIAEDAVRMDRLIADISDSSRVDAELSRTVAVPVDVAPILSTLAELHTATRGEGDTGGGAGGAGDGPGGARRGGAAGAGVPQPARQRALLQPARRHGAREGAAGGRLGGGGGGGRGAGHPGSEAGRHLRALLLGAAAGRGLRQAFGPRPLDQPADRGGIARADRGGEPAGRGGQGGRARGSSCGCRRGEATWRGPGERSRSLRTHGAAAVVGNRWRVRTNGPAAGEVMRPGRWRSLGSLRTNGVAAVAHCWPSDKWAPAGEVVRTVEGSAGSLRTNGVAAVAHWWPSDKWGWGGHDQCWNAARAWKGVCNPHRHLPQPEAFEHSENVRTIVVFSCCRACARDVPNRRARGECSLRRPLPLPRPHPRLHGRARRVQHGEPHRDVMREGGASSPSVNLNLSRRRALARSDPPEERPLEPMKPMKPMDFGPAWWPSDLGQPASSGGQNDVRYAFFPEHQRLAVEQNGKVSLYDSGDHRIDGVSQAQGGGDRPLAFTSEKGEVTLDQLKKIG